MIVTSKGVALILASCIAILTTLFLSLVSGVSTNALIVTSVISFSSSYILTNFILEFLIFREINRIYDQLDKLKERDFSFIKKGKKEPLNPLKRINQELFSYAEEKQKEIDDLKRLEVFRREFLANVSHELKTPLFAAQGFVHTLIDGAVKDKTVRNKFLKKAAKSLDGLNDLVQDLLTLSHLETGEITMHTDAFDLYPLVVEVFEELEGKAEKRQIKMAFDIESSSEAVVVADKRRIYQVLLNLISNAIKYNNEGGHVWVDLQVSKNDIMVFVKDDGIGIPPQDIKRVFERFYRVDKSRSKDSDSGGTGLGLGIVKHIIEAHKSTVSITSTLGKGSTFSFKLPRPEATLAVPSKA